jgi:hypothetical protein
MNCDPGKLDMKNKSQLARHQWFTPVIPATWENKIGRNLVEASWGKEFGRPPISKITRAAHTCNPSYQEATIRRITVQSQTGQNSSTRPYLQKPLTKIWLVEWLKVKALSSSPSTAK